jgi:DNA-binding NarL/FixJ family response regulator
MALEEAVFDAGHEVIGIADSANKAVALAVAARPDLTIMDVRLIGTRDGVDAAVEIYERCGTRSLFASAHDDFETKKRAELAVPLGWLAKPYTVAALNLALAQAVRELNLQ